VGIWRYDVVTPNINSGCPLAFKQLIPDPESSQRAIEGSHDYFAAIFFLLRGPL